MVYTHMLPFIYNCRIRAEKAIGCCWAHGEELVPVLLFQEKDNSHSETIPCASCMVEGEQNETREFVGVLRVSEYAAGARCALSLREGPFNALI